MSAPSAASSDVGIFNTSGAALTLTACTISGNSATDGAGGIFSYGTATLTDCTISGNYGLFAGGLWSRGTATLTDCTISGNSGAFTGGLYNDLFGVSDMTLEDTIVAENTGEGSPSDVGGRSLDNASSFNLIGTGGSDGLTNGQNGNIVLTTLAGLNLAPLGDYGGPTQTVALLPGSPALGTGMASSGVTGDQRGEPLASPPDIGAFQSQGFTIQPATGSTPQQTTAGTAFANPLAVVVTAKNPIEPVAGGTVTFTAPSSGARRLSRPTRSPLQATVRPR